VSARYIYKTAKIMIYKRYSISSVYKNAMLSNYNPRRRYPYFDVVSGLAWSEEPESYAGGSTATGRGSHAGQVKGDDPD
jgi:hypothetical protein